MVFVLRRERDVDGREQREHERLNHDDKAPQDHQRNGQDEGKEAHEDPEDEMIDGDVEHQTDGERDWTHAERDDLDRKDKPRQVPSRPGKVLDVGEPIRLQAIEVEEYEHHSSAAERDVQVARGHRHPRQQGHNIREEHEDRARANQGKVLLCSRRPHHALGQVVEVAEKDLHERAQRQSLVRNNGIVEFGEPCPRHHRQHQDEESDEDGRHDGLEREPRRRMPVDDAATDDRSVVLEVGLPTTKKERKPGGV